MNRVAATAAGSAASESAPSTTAAAAAGFRRGRSAALLLDVRTANGCRGDRAPDHAGHGDQRQHVREGLEQGCGAAGVRREALRERAREAEQKCRRERTAGTPLAEDQR